MGWLRLESGNPRQIEPLAVQHLPSPRPQDVTGRRTVSGIRPTGQCRQGQRDGVIVVPTPGMFDHGLSAGRLACPAKDLSVYSWHH